MATEQAPTAIQWVAVLVGGGIAGALASLVSTRIEWRRLRNEEAERSSFYEQRLFDTRLEAYSGLTARMTAFMHASTALLDSYRIHEDWSVTNHEVLVRSLEEAKRDLTAEVMQAALLFGSAMDEPLGAWTSAVNQFLGVGASGVDSQVAQVAYEQCAAAQYQVLQAMRTDLHFGELDAMLVKKLQALD